MQVFISHAPADRGIARELAARLSEAGYEAWTDQNLFPGENWSLEMGKALEQSEALIVLVSPEAAGSEWVRNEIQYALGSLRFENRVIPVQVRPTEDMPWILGKFQAVTPGEGDVAEISRHVLERLKASEVVAR